MNVYEIENDKSYARDVCREYAPAVKKVHNDFTDRLFYISKKFVNTVDYEDCWTYKTKSGKKVVVDDEVMDTYVWLVKQLIKKCCKYLGDKGASLSTYLIAILNSTFTFNDWLKWKYGDTSYVPKSIKQLPEEYWEIFKKLKQQLSNEQIATRLDRDLVEVNRKIQEIYIVLQKNKQLYMIEKPHFIEFEDDNCQDNKLTDPSAIADAAVVRKIFTNTMSSLEKPERRLLLILWSSSTRMSAKQALLVIKNDEDISNFKLLNINSEGDIYNTVNRIVKKILDYIQKQYKEFCLEYKFTENKCREMIKIYLENFIENEKN